MPFEVGSISPWAALAAIRGVDCVAAALEDLRRRLRRQGLAHAATPCCDAATERPGTGRAATRLMVRAIIARFYHRAGKRCILASMPKGSPGNKATPRSSLKGRARPEAEALEGHPSQ